MSESTEPDIAPESPEIDASENETGAVFRRRRRPVPVRQPWWKRSARQLSLGAAAVLMVALAAAGLRHWLLTSPDFMLASLGQIQVSGAQETTPEAVRQVFAADLGRNLLAIPLARRQRALQHLPWVAQASVLRLWPNRLAVKLIERQPAAFVREGTHVGLIAADGTLLPMVPGLRFQGAMLDGLALQGAGGEAELLQQRREQMALFLRLRQSLDAGGAHRLRDFSEIDLSDPRNVRVLVPLPAGAGAAAASARTLLLELGNRHFLTRYQLYLQHIQEWLSQYDSLRSVDLRYDGEAILNTGAGQTAAVPHPPASHL